MGFIIKSRIGRPYTVVLGGRRSAALEAFGTAGPFSDDLRSEHLKDCEKAGLCTTHQEPPENVSEKTPATAPPETAPKKTTESKKSVEKPRKTRRNTSGRFTSPRSRKKETE